MRKTIRSVAVGLSFALMPLGAFAGTISTPIIFLGDANQLVCIANNVSAASISVSVSIIGFTGTTTQACTLAASDRGGCQVFRNNDGGQCRIAASTLEQSEVQARVRGVLFSRHTTSPFAINGLVQAQ